MVGVRTMHVTFEIDGEAKALYIRLREGEIARTIEYAEEQEVFLDLDEQGQLIGVEVLDPAGINIESILKELSERYGIHDLSSLVNKSLVELAA
jgi:uncharacterized protein YuzE